MCNQAIFVLAVALAVKTERSEVPNISAVKHARELNRTSESTPASDLARITVGVDNGSEEVARGRTVASHTSRSGRHRQDKPTLPTADLLTLPELIL